MTDDDQPKFSLNRRTGSGSPAPKADKAAGQGEPKAWQAVGAAMREVSAPPGTPLSPEEVAKRAADAEAAFEMAQKRRKTAMATVAVFAGLALVGLAMQPLLFAIAALLALPVVSTLRRFSLPVVARMGRREVTAGTQLGVAGVAAAFVLFGLVPRWEQSGQDYVRGLCSIAKPVAHPAQEEAPAAALSPSEGEQTEADTATGDETETRAKPEVAVEATDAEGAEAGEKSVDETGTSVVSTALTTGRQTLEAGRGKISQGLSRFGQWVAEHDGWLAAKGAVWWFQWMVVMGLYVSLPWIRKPVGMGDDAPAKGPSWLGTYAKSIGAALAMKAGGLLIKGGVLALVMWAGLHYAQLPGAFFLAGAVGVLVLVFRPAPLVGVLAAVPMLLQVESMGMAAGILGGTWLVTHFLEGRLHRWLVAGPSGEAAVEKHRFGSGFSLVGMVRLLVSLAILGGLGWVGMTWFPMYQADEKYSEDVMAALDQYMSGDVVEAKEQLDALAAARPWDPRPYRGWLDGAVTGDNFEAALEVSEKIVELSAKPLDRPAEGFLEEKYLWLMQELDRVEEPLDALEGYERVLHMGRFSEHKGYRDQAAKRILTIDQEHLEALRHVADSLQYSADRQLSSQAALKVIALTGVEDAAMLKILTGNAQLDQNYEQALLYAQRWLAADPVDSDVKKALRQINAGLAN